jgi:hypothetical protein
LTLLVCLLVTRLVIWLAQVSGPTRWFFRLHPFLAELGECDLCLGCWIAPLIVWFFGVNLLAPLYVPVVSELVSGWLIAFGLHIGRLGWEAKFGMTVLSGPES